MLAYDSEFQYSLEELFSEHTLLKQSDLISILGIHSTHIISKVLLVTEGSHYLQRMHIFVIDQWF